VVKEANALSTAGYEVFVVFAQHASWFLAADQHILDHATWKGQAIELGSERLRDRAYFYVVRLRSFLFQLLARITLRSPFAELAYCRYLPEQFWFAVRARADLYIGHNPQSLPVVAWAARWAGAKYGFDYEDFHQGERLADSAEMLSDRLLRAIEERYITGAAHLTASSSGIAREVAALHEIPEPQTILNVFPWADRPELVSVSRSPKRQNLSLYWFSQIVGLDRGLQDVIQAMGGLPAQVELHIRGNRSAEVESELMRLAQKCGVRNRIIFHDVVMPQDLVSAAANHDVGLCLEFPSNLNRDLCVTNKLFVYMLAGLALIASRTRGQSELLDSDPCIGFLYNPGNSEELANIIGRLMSDWKLLVDAKRRSLEACRRRWNWEQESRALIDAVDQVCDNQK
jgi:glycosyltransferase involved in cell wall biosynthesis